MMKSDTYIHGGIGQVSIGNVAIIKTVVVLILVRLLRCVRLSLALSCLMVVTFYLSGETRIKAFNRVVHVPLSEINKI